MTVVPSREQQPRGRAVTVAASPAEHPGSIEAKRFSFWYGEKQALCDVDVAISPRAITALIGPSGCGKSTFLRSINRLNELILGVKWSGTIELDGENIYRPDMDVT